MAVINEAQLKEQISKKNFSNAYILFGEESYLKDFYTNQLKNKLVDSAFADFNYHEHDGSSANMDDIAMDSSMLPMMSEYSMVLVNDYPFENSSDVKKLEEILKELNGSSILVFRYEKINIDVKKSKTYSKVVNLFSKYGTAAELKKRTETDLINLVLKGAKKRNCSIDKRNAQYFISVVGSDIQTMLNELEKICSYIGEGEITKDTIDEVAVKSLQARIYDLSKFILAKNGEAAYGLLNALFSQKADEIVILSVLSSCYIDMYRAKCAVQANISDNNVSSTFGYRGREFVIRNAKRDSSRISINALRNALSILAEADEKLKSTAVSKAVILEETDAKLLIIR